jgi:hypothetical protein
MAKRKRTNNDLQSIAHMVTFFVVSVQSQLVLVIEASVFYAIEDTDWK